MASTFVSSLPTEKMASQQHSSLTWSTAHHCRELADWVPQILSPSPSRQLFLPVDWVPAPSPLRQLFLPVDWVPRILAPSPLRQQFLLAYAVCLPPPCQCLACVFKWLPMEGSGMANLGVLFPPHFPPPLCVSPPV